MNSLLRKKGNQPVSEQPTSWIAGQSRHDGSDLLLPPLRERSYCDDGYRGLVELIEAAPEPDRTIIMAHVQGYSYAEIASITGLTRAAVSMRLTRTLRKIRKQYYQR